MLLLLVFGPLTFVVLLNSLSAALTFIPKLIPDDLGIDLELWSTHGRGVMCFINNISQLDNMWSVALPTACICTRYMCDYSMM